MATVEECRQALHSLADKMAAAAARNDPPALDRSVSCRIPDLGTGFRARLSEGKLHDITDGEDPDAQITLTAGSDDLVALSAGQLNFSKAWATDRLKIDASFMDLLKLRNLL